MPIVARLVSPTFPTTCARRFDALQGYLDTVVLMKADASTPGGPTLILEQACAQSRGCRASCRSVSTSSSSTTRGGAAQAETF